MSGGWRISILAKKLKILCIPKDLANHWTDMVLLYSEASLQHLSIKYHLVWLYNVGRVTVFKNLKILCVYRRISLTTEPIWFSFTVRYAYNILYIKCHLEYGYTMSGGWRILVLAKNLKIMCVYLMILLTTEPIWFSFTVRHADNI